MVLTSHAEVAFQVEALLVKREEEEEAAEVAEYRGIVKRIKEETSEFSTQEIYDARQVVSDLIRSGEKLEEVSRK